MQKKTIRIMLVDDHLLFREGMSSLLSRDERFEILSEADDGETALEIVEDALPDIILMDVKMPGMGGIEATQKLLTKHPDLKVIMITASEKDEDLFEAVKAGAQGYILKTVSDTKYIRESIFSVAAGDAIIPPAMAPRLLNEFANLAKGKPSVKKIIVAKKTEEKITLLTPRENEVLALVAQGLTNKEIGKRLVISENTVRSHLRFILDKLHINNRVQAALWFQKEKNKK